MTPPPPASRKSDGGGATADMPRHLARWHWSSKKAKEPGEREAEEREETVEREEQRSERKPFRREQFSATSDEVANDFAEQVASFFNHPKHASRRSVATQKKISIVRRTPSFG